MKRRAYLTGLILVVVLWLLLSVTPAWASTPVVNSFSPLGNTPLWVNTQTQTFTIKCTDSTAATHLSWVELLFTKIRPSFLRVPNPAMNTTPNGIRVRYLDTVRINPITLELVHIPKIQLMKEDGTYATGLPGAAGTLENTRAIVKLAQCSVTTDTTGKTVTVTVAIAFKASKAWPGYVKAQDDARLETKWDRRTTVTAQAVISPYMNWVASQGGYWLYKGQLHCHSNMSDGEQSRAATLLAYKSAKYKFVCLTDHNYVGTSSEPAAAVTNILWVRGEEDSPTWPYPGPIRKAPTRRRHMGAVGLPGLVGPDGNSLNGQQRIDWVKNKGGFPVINHPYDARLGWPDSELRTESNIGGIELNATLSAARNNKALILLDWLSQGGGLSRPWIVAADDCHNCVVSNTNFNRGWVLVRSTKDPHYSLLSGYQEDTRKDLVRNLKKGNFFAVYRDPDGTGGALDSTYDGQTYDIIVSSAGNGEPIVTVTALGGRNYRKISFYEAPGLSASWRIVKTESNVTTSSYQLQHRTRFVRVVAEDVWPASGGQVYRIYSQPISVSPYCAGSATEAVSAFQAAPAPSPLVWPNISKSSMASDVAATVADPNEVNQDGENLCGPAAIVYELAKRSPVRYVDLARALYESGGYRLGDFAVVKPQSNLYGYAVPGWISAADWVVLASLRDSQNGWFDYDPGDSFEGITTSGDMKKWSRDLLQFNTVEWKSSYSTGEIDAIKKARDWFNAGGVAFLMVNSRMVNSPDPMSDLIPDHWIAYEGGLTIANGRVKYNAYTWGNVVQVDVSQSDFEHWMWGVVTAK